MFLWYYTSTNINSVWRSRPYEYSSATVKNSNDLIDKVNLKFACDVDFPLSVNYLESTIYDGLKCFRGVLIKK